MAKPLWVGWCSDGSVDTMYIFVGGILRFLLTKNVGFSGKKYHSAPHTRRFMALASSDFSSMPPTSYFLSNGKENARKLFFSLPMKKRPRKREKKRFFSRFPSHLRENRRSAEYY